MLIFDFDGTLVDSHGVWHEVDLAFLQKRNLPYTDAYYEGVAHTILSNCARFTKDFFHLEESCEEIIAEWMELAGDRYEKDIPLLPHVKEYLERCRESGHQMAVFTACVPSHCQKAMERLNITQYFTHVIYAEEMGIDKKDPASFRRLCEILEVSPKDCVLFDDSLSACKSAKANGLTVVGILNPKNPGSNTDMMEYCDRTIRDFSELL